MKSFDNAVLNYEELDMVAGGRMYSPTLEQLRKIDLEEVHIGQGKITSVDFGGSFISRTVDVYLIDGYSESMYTPKELVNGVGKLFGENSSEYLSLKHYVETGNLFRFPNLPA